MNYLPPQRPQSPPFTALQRRLLGLAGVLATLMIALIVFHALHTGSTGLDAVAEAAERTARQPGAKLALEVTYGTPGSSKTISGTGSGLYDARTGLSSADLALPVPGHGTERISSVGNEKQVFVRSPVFAGELPAGKEWLGMEPFLGHSVQTALGSNGSGESQLEVLGTVGGDVQKLDQQTVRGHLTTRYSGTVEFTRAAQVFAEAGEESLAHEYEHFAELMPDPIPVEVWIDERGLVRQFRITEQIPTSGGASLTTDMRYQFYAFGPQHGIKLPPRRKVFDFTPILRAELGLEDGSTLGPLTPPAGAKPLSVTAFQRRAGDLCRTVLHKAKSIFHRHVQLFERAKALGPSATKSTEGRELMSAYGSRVIEPIDHLVRHGYRELAAIAPPPSLASAYRRYLKMNARSIEWNLAEARLLELGQAKAPALEARRSEAKAEGPERKKLAARLGIPICESSVGGAGSNAETTPS